MELVGGLPKTICFRDVFNPLGAFGVTSRKNLVADEIADFLDLPILEERDPDLIDFVRNEPELFLRFVEATVTPKGIHWCGATIFDGQLSTQQFQSVITSEDTFVVLLKRRNLDRAISLKKARLTGVWKGQDTSEFRPELTVQDVEKPMNKSSAWFEFVENCLEANDVPFVQLSYEDHVLSGAESVLLNLAERFPEFDWAKGDTIPDPSIQVQDRTSDIFERISNGSMLRNALEQQGILDAAMGYPGRV